MGPWFDGGHLVSVKKVITGGGTVVRVEILNDEPLPILRRALHASPAADAG